VDEQQWHAQYPEAAFELEITHECATDGCPDSASILLDGLSLLPMDSVGGLWRPDVYDKVAALKPGFIRMPGGNYLEGTGMRTRWDWKATLGPREERAGHYNSAWGYWVTDAVGLHELLSICESLDSVPQLSVYTGYSMGREYVPLNRSWQFAQDALDLVEYATGSPESPYGKLRAAAGHPAPFTTVEKLRLEVGNEEARMGAEDYPAHYQLITNALWKRYPNLTVVASGRWNGAVPASPCLTGQRCDAWDDHYYRTPDQMAAMGHEYDSYNRSWPDVFVGEFAANVGGQMTLQAGVSEAIFMLGFEVNGDKVKSASFAPMLRNVNATQWAYDLINFDAYRSAYALPSYYMQTMFREAAGEYLLESTLSTNSTALATASLQGQDLIIKIAWYNESATTLNVSLKGFGSFRSDALLTTLTSQDGADAVNSFEAPEAVVPTQSKATISDAGVVISIPAWSISVLRMTPA